MKAMLRLIVTSLLFSVFSFAETAVVKRNVTLRPDPSTDNQAITTLGPGQRVSVVSLRKRNGYLRVIVSKQQGWVWARNVDIEESPVEETEELSKRTDHIPDAAETCTVGNPNGVNHVGPPELYPDPLKTPGCAATLETGDLTKAWTENCPSGKDSCTYSQAHRKVSKGERTAIYEEYSVPPPRRNIDNGEIDHFYPLCAGGSNSTSNLWYQPIDNAWSGRNFGFKEKDKLESWICKQIKLGKLDPREAFDRMTKDWVRFYKEEIPNDDELKDQIADDEGDGGQ